MYICRYVDVVIDIDIDICLRELRLWLNKDKFFDTVYRETISVYFQHITVNKYTTW